MPENAIDLGTFEPAPLGEFTVQVLDDTGEPVQGLELTVTLDGGQETARTTDANGTINLPAPESNLKLTLPGKGKG